MNSLVRHRLVHYVVLFIAWAVITLPGLGSAALTDADEGLNAEAAREMYESGDWVVPRFNFQLRDAKPALLYWFQTAAYHAFGVSEFAARLPSALAALLAAVTVYELGRSMFSASAGVIAGFALLGCGLVCAMARFANPDALLLACTCLSFLAFWIGFSPRQPDEAPRGAWFIPFGAACGLGMLAKGPVALALPGLVILLFLAWERRLGCLWDRRLILGAAAFVAVAAPWYLMVTIETRGAFARGFFIKNNIDRYLTPIGDHRGAPYYHPLMLLIGFAPWSVWILPTLWYAVRGSIRRNELPHSTTSALRLLICWFAVYLAFFTGAATKLPGYTLPLYPALALLTAHFVEGWRRGDFRPLRVVMGYSFAWLVLIGLATTAALLIGAGIGPEIRLPFRPIPSLANRAWLGLIPLMTAGFVLTLALAARRQAAILVFAIAAIGFIGTLYSAWTIDLDEVKAPRELVRTAGLCQRDRDLRLAWFQYTQPSLVFYCQREVATVGNEEQAAQFLAIPTPGFLVMPREVWESARDRLPGREVASRWDIYRHCEVVVVSNAAADNRSIESQRAEARPDPPSSQSN